MNDDSPPVKSSKATYWMIYLGLLVAAIVLIGDGLSISHLERWTGRVGIGVLFMTLVLIASRSVPGWLSHLALSGWR